MLDYRVLAHLDNLAPATLVEFAPRTGRMHQLRVQSASRGFPILGDELYGSTQPFGPPAESLRDRFIALHARCICIEHPTRHVPLSVTAPLPDYWQTLGLPPGLSHDPDPDRLAEPGIIH